MAEAGSGGDTSLKRQATYTHKRMNNGVHDLLTIGSGTEKTREALKPIYVRTFTFQLLQSSQEGCRQDRVLRSCIAFTPLAWSAGDFRVRSRGREKAPGSA